MSGPDGGLRTIAHRELKRLGMVCTPIETGGTVSGVPDTYWTQGDPPLSGWIEHKATNGWAVTFRPQQLGFLLRAHRAGVRTGLLIRARGAGSGGASRDRLWVVHGRAAATLSEDGLRAVAPADVLLVCDGPVRRWDWAAVHAALCT